MRLHWEEIDFDQDHIEVKGRETRRRHRGVMLPLLPNLKSWLKTYRESTQVRSALLAKWKRKDGSWRKTLEIEWPN